MERDRPFFGDPRPSEVPGYRRAAEVGFIPPVPPTPPRLLPGPTADTLSKRLLGAGVMWMVAFGSVILVVDKANLDVPVVGFLVFLILAGLGFVGLLRLMGGVGRRNYEELAHGYSTITAVYALWESSEDRRFAKLRWNVPWDFSGCWVLRGDGSVVSAPSENSIEPPGFYPSPHDPHRFELWTGAAWSGVFDAPLRRV